MNFDIKAMAVAIISGILVAVSIGFYLNYRHMESKITTLEVDKKNLEANLVTSQNSVHSLQDAINQRNALIDKMKQDSDARDKKYQVLIDAANKKAVESNKRAHDIMSLRPTTGNVCKDTDDLLNKILFGS